MYYFNIFSVWLSINAATGGKIHRMWYLSHHYIVIWLYYHQKRKYSLNYFPKSCADALTSFSFNWSRIEIDWANREPGRATKKVAGYEFAGSICEHHCPMWRQLIRIGIYTFPPPFSKNLEDSNSEYLRLFTWWLFQK